MVKKPTPSSPSFPWEQLKAESMRSICRDLGLKVSHNRSVMTHFLESVSKVGLPRALALDGAEEDEEEEKKSVLPTPSSSSRKRTRATANEDTDEQQQSISARPRSNKRQATTAKPRPVRGRAKREQVQAGEEQEQEQEQGGGGNGEESSGQPSPSKRYRISVTSDYNTRFKADRRGRMSDPGPRGGRRRARVSFAAPLTPGGRGASRRGPAARARAGGRGKARARAVTLGGAQQDGPAGRRVRVVEPGSSETADENDGDDEGVGGSVVVVRRVASVGGLVNGARRARRLPSRARAVLDGGAPKLVFDGVHVPRLSKAVVEAIKKRDMVLYDEDADGEVDEAEQDDGGEVGVVPGEEEGGEEGAAPEDVVTGAEGAAPEDVVTGAEGAAPEDVGAGAEGAASEDVGAGAAPESVGEEGAGEEGVAPPEGEYEEMAIDEGEVEGESGAEEEEEAQIEELIPDDSSSLGNSNKENEAPEDEEMGEEPDAMGMEVDTIGVTMVNIEEDISGLAAEALFGAGASANTSVPVQSGENDILGEEDF